MLRRISCLPGTNNCKKILELLVVAVLWTLEGGAAAQEDHGCSQTPLPCVMTQLGIPVRHSCERDSNCLPGRRCCFRGCVRACVPWDPCQTVVCNPGYTCTLRFSSPWAPEADCVPDEHELCQPLSCGDSKTCPPGFQTRLDKDGCPTCDCEPKD
ncbi:hypothetical protein EGW08_019039, partial [Elysia chlorotica]